MPAREEQAMDGWTDRCESALAVNDVVEAGLGILPTTPLATYIPVPVSASTPLHPLTMKQYNLTHRTSLAGLVRRDDAPEPQLTRPNDILIRIKAIALNSRDLQVATGLYPAQHPIPDNVVPVSGTWWCGTS